MNKKFALNKKYNDAGMIQIWNFGELQNGKHSQMPNPVLEYCLCHDFGYISQMEWCPSGCYGEERLGLLAIASSDSNVYVYSLPFAKELGR